MRPLRTRPVARTVAAEKIRTAHEVTTALTTRAATSGLAPRCITASMRAYASGGYRPLPP